MYPVGLGNTQILTDYAQNPPQTPNEGRQNEWTSRAIVPKMPVMLYVLLCWLPFPIRWRRIKTCQRPKTPKLLRGMCESRNMFFQLRERDIHAFPLNYFDVDGSSTFSLLLPQSIVVFGSRKAKRKREGGTSIGDRGNWDGKWSQCQQVLDPNCFFKVGYHSRSYNEDYF